MPKPFGRLSAAGNDNSELKRLQFGVSAWKKNGSPPKLSISDSRPLPPNEQGTKGVKHAKFHLYVVSYTKGDEFD